VNRTFATRVCISKYVNKFINIVAHKNARFQLCIVLLCSNNNNNANICIARLKQNSSGALMAQTNTVSVFVQMTAVTASGVADRPEDSNVTLY